MTAPCKGCDRRTVHPNCHSTCKAYKEYAEERNRINAQKLERGVILGYAKERQKRR